MPDLPAENLEPNARVTPKRRRWARCGCIVLVVMAVLLIAGVIFIRMNIRADYTDQEWEQLKAAEEEVLQLPPEWHQPAELPPAEVVDFAFHFYPQAEAMLTTHGELLLHTLENRQDLLQRMRKGEEITPEEETSISRFMADMEPLVEVSSATVQIPGYTLELDLITPNNSFLALQTFSKYASIAALWHLRNGDAVQAIETAALPMRLTQRPESSSVMNHLIAMAVSTISVHTLYAIADTTSDTEALQRGIELLDEIRSEVFVGNINNWRYGDVFSSLRFAAAYGYPVSLEPQPLVDYSAQLMPFQTGHYYSWIVENLPADDPRTFGARARLEALRRPPIDFEKLFNEFREPESADDNPDPIAYFEELEQQEKLELDMSETTRVPTLQVAFAKLVYGLHPYSILHGIAMASYDETEDRARVSMAMYDLTQIHFARRLAELRGEAPADNSEWLKQLPALETVPQDPFTSEPYKYSDGANAPYSVGPDREDDGAGIMYDATNGTTSAGDVWMRRM